MPGASSRLHKHLVNTWLVEDLIFTLCLILVLPFWTVSPFLALFILLFGLAQKPAFCIKEVLCNLHALIMTTNFLQLIHWVVFVEGSVTEAYGKTSYIIRLFIAIQGNFSLKLTLILTLNLFLKKFLKARFCSSTERSPLILDSNTMKIGRGGGKVRKCDPKTQNYNFCDPKVHKNI